MLTPEQVRNRILQTIQEIKQYGETERRTAVTGLGLALEYMVKNTSKAKGWPDTPPPDDKEIYKDM